MMKKYMMDSSWRWANWLDLRLDLNLIPDYIRLKCRPSSIDWKWVSTLRWPTPASSDFTKDFCALCSCSLPSRTYLSATGYRSSSWWCRITIAGRIRWSPRGTSANAGMWHPVRVEKQDAQMAGSMTFPLYFRQLPQRWDFIWTLS